jgi:hypothetical protein
MAIIVVIKIAAAQDQKAEIRKISRFPENFWQNRCVRFRFRA